MTQTRYVEMYSLIQWDDRLRKVFQLGYDPYYYEPTSIQGVAASKARELLSELGCFYYRDSENGQSSVMLKPKSGLRYEEITGKQQYFNPSLTCYFYSAHIAYPSITPVDYPPPTRISEAEKYEDYKAKWKDTKQWLHWGESREILEVAPGHVRHVRTQPITLPNATPIAL